MKNGLSILLATITTTIFISACSPSDNNANIPKEPVALSAELSSIYQRSCKNCHEIPATSAPQTGDIAQWNKILGQGMETVLDHAMSGYRGMPSSGQCFDCTPEQIEILITYMSNPKK